MDEVLLWILAVFCVLCGPPLFVLWSERQREKREVEQLGQHRLETGGRERTQPGMGQASGLRRLWPAVMPESDQKT